MRSQRLQLQVHVFNEVPMRPGMLPVLLDPRRSQITPYKTVKDQKPLENKQFFQKTQ